MKKIFLMLFIMIAANAQAEPQDSLKTYNSGDIVMTTGVTMMASGAVSFLASRSIALGLIGTGGVVTVIGVAIKIKNRKPAKQ